MTDEVQYSLKFQVVTDMSVAHLPEVTNKITFSATCAVHGLPLQTLVN